MRLPRRISPAAARRRSLLIDAIAALALATVALVLSAGLGITAVLGLVTLALVGAWVAAESILRRMRERRKLSRRRAQQLSGPASVADRR